jgi:hypothetical protein
MLQQTSVMLQQTSVQMLFCPNGSSISEILAAIRRVQESFLCFQRSKR